MSFVFQVAEENYQVSAVVFSRWLSCRGYGETLRGHMNEQWSNA